MRDSDASQPLQDFDPSHAPSDSGIPGPNSDEPGSTNEIASLLAQIQDKALQARLSDRIAELKKLKKFGLAFEEHLPELLPFYSGQIAPGSKVALRSTSLAKTYTVRRIDDGVAACETDGGAGSGSLDSFDLTDLTVVRRFGEPIFPMLRPFQITTSIESKRHHVLIEADNYHALQLLCWSHRKQIDCIYIDPPYNTGAKDWKYNNDFVDINDTYRHSKWLSMMQRRLKLAETLLRPDGVLCVTIDDYEMHHLRCLLEDSLPDFEVLGVVPIKNNPAGRTTTAGFAVCHEYAFFLGRQGLAVISRLERTERQKSRYKELDDIGPFEWANFRKHGGKDTYRKTRPRQFYPIYVSGKRIRIPIMEWNEGNREWNILEPPTSDEEVLLPINELGEERIWDFGVDTARAYIPEFLVRADSAGKTALYRKWRMKSEGLLPQTWWDKSTYSAAEYGTNMLADILGEKHRFPFPKSVYAVKDCLQVMCGSKKSAIILDFFAGSGTTFHATAMLNIQDGGDRQAILVTNNALSIEDEEILRARGLRPGDEEWESRGICRSATFPRCCALIEGARPDGTRIPGTFLTGQIDRQELKRKWTALTFAINSDLMSETRRMRLAARRTLAQVLQMPAGQATGDDPWLYDARRGVAVLLDIAYVGEFTEFFVDDADRYVSVFVVCGDSELKAISDTVDEQWSPAIRTMEIERDFAKGLDENLAYFRLDFLDKERLEVGADIDKLFPILWLRAGARGQITTTPAPDFVFPVGGNFAILLDPYAINNFLAELKEHGKVEWVYIFANSEETFARMSATLPDRIDRLKRIHMTKSYLEHFSTNVEA